MIWSGNWYQGGTEGRGGTEIGSGVWTVDTTTYGASMGVGDGTGGDARFGARHGAVKPDMER